MGQAVRSLLEAILEGDKVHLGGNDAAIAAHGRLLARMVGVGSLMAVTRQGLIVSHWVQVAWLLKAAIAIVCFHAESVFNNTLG